jgi:hypothetical protein
MVAEETLMKPTNFPFLAASQMLRCGFILCVVLQFGDAKADDWTTYQHDAAHTGRSTANFDPASLTKVWGSSSGNSQPIVVGNALYDLSNSGATTNPLALTSYNLVTGQKNWSANFPLGIGTHLSFADGLLLAAGGVSSSTYKMFVWDAANGTQKYVVDLPAFTSGSLLTPTAARNVNNQLVAYVAGGQRVAAVALGASSGNVLWTSSAAGLGGFSIPTVVGDSIILNGPADNYAFDQLTGASNHFFGTGGSGGGGETVAYDSARKQIYVRDPGNGLLTAFSYTSQSSISQVWQVPANILGGSVAIGADGGIYLADSTSLHSLFERDPTDGHLIKSISMATQFSNGVTPLLSANSLFIWSSEGQTKVYDLDTFALIRTLPKGRGDSNTAYQGPGAIFDNGYVLYRQDGSTGGFDVYWAIPEPSTLLLAVIALAALPTRRRKSVSRTGV